MTTDKIRSNPLELKAIAPKIQKGAAAWYELMFPSLHEGAATILEIFPGLYKDALSEVRETILQKEFLMIIDVLINYNLRSRMSAGRNLLTAVSEAFELSPNHYEEKYEIDNPSNFVEKLNNLPRTTRCCIEIWAMGYWGQYNDFSGPDDYYRKTIWIKLK